LEAIKRAKAILSYLEINDKDLAGIDQSLREFFLGNSKSENIAFKKTRKGFVAGSLNEQGEFVTPKRTATR